MEELAVKPRRSLGQPAMNLATLDRWDTLCLQAGLSPSGAWYDRLINAWSQPHRHYHDLTHLNECLAHLDSATSICRDPQAVEIALWFHDAVYDPKAPDNEELSADLAGQFLREAKAHESFTHTIRGLILSTKTHETSGIPDGELMLDIDLSILGQPPDRYQKYETDVRREYAWVPEGIFAEKRAEILQRFLARPAIYRTSWFHERFENQARQNLDWSLHQLASE